MDVSPTSRLANNLFANVLSLRKPGRLVSPDHWLKGKGGKYMCIGLYRVTAEEQDIHVQRLFRFLSGTT